MRKDRNGSKIVVDEDVPFQELNMIADDYTTRHIQLQLEAHPEVADDATDEDVMLAEYRRIKMLEGAIYDGIETVPTGAEGEE